jgi:glycerol-3-phosphate acyltransferase PlsY
LDTLKGFVVILAVQQTDFGDTGLFWAALGVVVGHNWPAYLRFKGGKGVATVFGVSLAVLPVLTVLSVVIAVVSGLITRNVIFGISIAFVTLNILTIITGQSAATVITCLVLSGIIILAHFGLAHREVLASIRAKGVWGLFEVD